MMRASLKLSVVAGVIGSAVFVSAIHENDTSAALAQSVRLKTPPDAHRLIAAKPTARGVGGTIISNQALVNSANTFVDLLSKNKFAQSTTLLAPRVKSVLPAPKLQLAWQALTMQYGPFKQKNTPYVETAGGITSVFVPAVFGNETVDFRVVFINSTKVNGFFVEPHKGDFKEASYVDPKSFTEQNVKVGSAKWQLDGVLTIPNGDGPFPAVVLVHGSGPHDRDETVGPNKPFRDLARGLASKGIAVIRYDKRTKQHAKLLTGADLKNLTMKEETVDDAVEAVKTLRANAKIDKSKVVVLGHSLGGTAVPRIAKADSGINGFIMLAGSNEAIDSSIVRQSEYIASLSPATEAGKKQLAMLKSTAAKVSVLKPADADNNVLILGAAPLYWLDLKKHDPIEEIKEIDKPILFLQGERDYQVTAAGDFERWKNAVKSAGHESKCEFKLYPQLNHLFSSGTGKCGPNEYMKRAANVDETVVNDIAAWVKGLS
jgi:uncharacterized protein